MAESLEGISRATGVGLDRCKEAVGFVREFPLGWGFHGPEGSQSGFIAYYHPLREDVFGAVRAAVRNVPYAALEAWGKDPAGFTYFAELVIPGEALAETMEFLGRVNSAAGDSFSGGIYQASQLQSYPLSRRIADGPPGSVKP